MNKFQFIPWIKRNWLFKPADCSKELEQKILKSVEEGKPSPKITTQIKNANISWLRKSFFGASVLAGICVLYSVLNPSYVYQIYYTTVKDNQTNKIMKEFHKQMNEEEDKFNNLIKNRYEEKLNKNRILIQPDTIEKSNFFE